MAYCQFTNIHKIFQGDLVSKLNADLDSLDSMYCPCNCSRPCKVDGECAYKAQQNQPEATAVHPSTLKTVLSD
eukprot:6578753-Ditylum_brightwellii.AAC.1